MFEKTDMRLKLTNDPTEYGDVIYSSPTTYLCAGDRGEISELKWEVTKMNNSYNVLTKIIQNKIIQKRLIQSFSWRESAMKFALEMLLVCNRKLNRHGFIE